MDDHAPRGAEAAAIPQEPCFFRSGPSPAPSSCSGSGLDFGSGRRACTGAPRAGSSCSGRRCASCTFSWRHTSAQPPPPPPAAAAQAVAPAERGGSTRTCLRPQESWSRDWHSFLNSSRVLAFASLGLANAPLPRPASAAALRSRSAAVKVFSPNPRPIPPPVPRPRQPHVRPRERQHHSRRRRWQAEPRSSRPRRRGRRAHWAVAAARPSAEELAGYLGVMCWAVGSNVEPHDAAYCNAHPCESECDGGEAGVGGGEAGRARPRSSRVLRR